MENTQVKENPFKGMMDEEAVKRSMEMPTQAMDILFDTSRMVNAGEDNYLMMTVSLYLSIFNIFVSLLNILGASRD